jgi:hypothetical protein
MRYKLLTTWAIAGCVVAAMLSGTACKPKEAAKPRVPGEVTGAATELGAALQRLVAAAIAKNVAVLEAAVDGELAFRSDTIVAHARARAADQVPIAERAAAQVKDSAIVGLKAREIVARLSSALVKECRFEGEVANRTPRWPTKKRTGWAFIDDSAAILAHVYDAYVLCKSGYNLEVRFVRRAGQNEWKVAGATELPFGVTRPPEPPAIVWD